jgi:hypothetical protein
MNRETDRIAVGTRFKISELGAVRCPKLAGKIGIVVGLGRHNTGITVMFDGDRRPTCLHRGYISSLSEQHQGHLKPVSAGALLIGRQDQGRAPPGAGSPETRRAGGRLPT